MLDIFQQDMGTLLCHISQNIPQKTEGQNKFRHFFRQCPHKMRGHFFKLEEITKIENNCVRRRCCFS